MVRQEEAEDLHGRHVSTEELQGRLVFLGLCSSAGPEDSEGHSASTAFHQRMRAEVDGILQGSLRQRREKFEGKVNRLLKGDGGTANGGESTAATNGCSSPTSVAVPKLEQTSQTNLTGQVEAPNRLADAHEKAIKYAMLCSRPPEKRFVERKCRQNAFAEPPEKEEPIKKESFVLRNTLEALRQNIGNRQRQIGSLQSQIAACKEHHDFEEQSVARHEETLRTLTGDGANMHEIHADWASKRSAEKEKLSIEHSHMKSEAKRYEVLAKSQHAFFLQTEAIFQRTGQEKIHRFPAGDVFLMPQPLPMDEDEKVEDYDVATAVANPYNVDSWPFEPNVLARRSSQECPMDEVREETFEELVEARRPVSRPPVIMNFGGRDNSDDDDDDDGAGPSATSRSL